MPSPLLFQRRASRYGGLSTVPPRREPARRARVLEDYYTPAQHIGAGHFADVFDGVDTRTGDTVALKRVLKPASTKPGRVRDAAAQAALEYARSEADIHLRLAHPHIVRAYDVFESSRAHTLVLERVPGGDLFDLLADSDAFSEAFARHVATQLLSALAYLHERGIVHRDVKPENVLLEADLTVKLCDFGLARQARCAGEAEKDGAFDDHCLTSALGTPSYCAPEIVRRQRYGRPVDMFALGVLTAFVLSGHTPFDGETPDEVLRAIVDSRSALRGRAWERATPAARDFVMRMIADDPSERMTASEALQHEWITGSKCVESPRIVGRAVAQVRERTLSTLSLSSVEKETCTVAPRGEVSAGGREPVEEMFAWL